MPQLNKETYDNNYNTVRLVLERRSDNVCGSMEEGLALPGELGARDGMSRVMRHSLDGKASELGNRKAGS